MTASSSSVAQKMTISGYKTSIDEILPRTGVYVPLYSYPGTIGAVNWNAVAKAKLAHPSVPMIVCINPSNGAGSFKDDIFVNGINRLKSVGCIVIGYIYTSYGARNPGVIKDEITKYRSWYDLDGIMFDEMANRVGYEHYYRDLTTYAKSLGMKFVKGNPGTDVPPSFVNIMDNLAISEVSGYPSMSLLSGWHASYDKRNWSYVAYEITKIDLSVVMRSSQFVGLMYITNEMLPNPYSRIPPYFEELVSALDETRSSNNYGTSRISHKENST